MTRGDSGRPSRTGALMQHYLFRALSIFWLATPVSTEAKPETKLCDTTNISVSGARPGDLELACDAVRAARAVFEKCAIPLPEGVLKIEIVDDMEPGCVGLFHCGEGRIEVLSPGGMAQRRAATDAFGHLTIESYFRSIIVHEVAHALFDVVPCPFDACHTANEYIAYAIQIKSLTARERAGFEASYDFKRRVSRDELSTMILFMAPGLFAQKTWAHLSQRDDTCGYLGRILDGTVLLDHERH